MNTTTEITTEPEQLKCGQKFGQFTLVGAVPGGFHVVCKCGRDVIVEQLISGPDTEDFQKCRKCHAKARKAREFFNRNRRKRVENWIAQLCSGRPVEATKELVTIIRRLSGCLTEQFEDMTRAEQADLLHSILRDNPRNGTG
jgi:hypothetical protein